MAKENKQTRVNGDTVYRKVGRRYEPIGMCTPIDWFNEGIWVLRKNKHSKQFTSGDYLYDMIKMCNISNEMTIQELASIDSYVDYVLMSKEWSEFQKGPHSMVEITSFILAKAFEYNKILKEKKEKETCQEERIDIIDTVF